MSIGSLFCQIDDFFLDYEKQTISRTFNYSAELVIPPKAQQATLLPHGKCSF